MELNNIWAFLWAPIDFIKEECSIKDNARLKKVKKHWKKCFHYGHNSPGIDTTADPSSNHKLVIPGKNERICTLALEGEGSYIMMLESLWHQLKIRFPFSNLQIEVLHNLHLAPTQLHPNGWGFLQAFELFCWANNWKCSSALFLYIFGHY
jgi:hypothetical protein